MPTITAGSIVAKAQIVLQDTTGIRWPDTSELLGWLNDGQREVAMMRPDACTVTSTSFSCAAGSRQTLPAAATALVDVVRNSSGNAVRKVPREILDAQRPGWHTETQAATKHYVYDPRTPREFFVYPPAVAAAALTLKYQTAPTDAASLAATITVDDIYAPPLIDYILWRAYSKDADYTANAERASAARSAFEKVMAIKAQADAAQTPRDNVKG